MSKKVLHIEDNKLSRRLVRHALVQEGFTVIEAVDGISGIRAALAEEPDLILMDINLPGMDGYEAATRIKSEPILSQTPIVALTSNTMPGDRERSLVSGCDGYLPKPIDIEDFAAQIRAFLEGERETIEMDQANFYLQEYRDKLVCRLQDKIEELTELNLELERRVDERTHELQKTQEKLFEAEKQRTIVQLASSIGHELRQPQTVINGLIGLILDENYDQAHLGRDLKAICEHIKEMSRLIDSMARLKTLKIKTYGEAIQILDLQESAGLNAQPANAR
jgi:CheY-like chemotaxis protein